MGGYVEKFKKEERDFAKILGSFGIISESNDEQDINEHWDLRQEILYDVKAMKKRKRSDTCADENIHWVELKNVNGSLGWLYGKAHKFAFELEDYWVVVDKEKLQNLIKIKCKDKEQCEYPELYKLYSRKDRSDIITLCKTIDLVFISDKIYPKTTEN